MQYSCEPPQPVDASSLHAALSVIDDWELDFGFLFSSSPDETVVEKNSPPRRLSCSMNGSGSTSEETSRAPYKGRNRRKLEIQALREHAEQLQRQLELTTRITNEAAAAREKENTEQNCEFEGLEGVWEDLSRRQLLQRQFAETENCMLRSELQTHIQTARQVLSVSRKALKTQGLVPRSGAENAEFDKEFVPPAEHLAQLGELYSQTDSVFSRTAYTSGRKEFQSIQVTDDGANGMIVLFEVARLLPFDVAGVADALFQHTVRMSSNDRVYEFKDLIQHDDSLVSLFVGLSTMNDIEGTMQGQIATRRYASSPTSAVIVSKVYADVLKTDLLPFRMSGEGWLRCVEQHRGVATSAAGTDAKTSPLTQVQWFRRIRISPLHSSRMPVLPDLHGSIATRVKHNLNWNLQAVENLLLSQSRRKHGTFLHDHGRHEPN